MKILIITETLYPRGAETFLVRLANVLCKKHEVILLNLHPFYSKDELISKVDPKIHLISRKQAVRKVVEKIDGGFIRLGMDNSLSNNHIIKTIGRILIENKIDVVHSHLFKADYYVAKARVKYNLSFNHVSTNHGDYLLFDKVPPVRIINYAKKLDFTLKHTNHMVNISNEQVALFTEWKQQHKYGIQLHKVLNGYYGEVAKPVSREALGIPEDSFVFGMVASGIAEKGWDQAIEAFNKIKNSGTTLVLVGEGHRLEELRATHSNDRQIIFTGLAKNPLDYVQMFNVGILPTYYAAESLPTVIIEYLYMNKPVLATNVGEIQKMLQVENGEELAGEIIDFTEPSKIVAALANKMADIRDNKALYQRLESNTRSAFKKFEMDKCIDLYIKIYNSH